MKKGVLLGFSGGVDSVASALALQEQGYAVTLATLQLTNQPQLIAAAQHSAEQIGMPLQVIDVRERFRNEIIHYFTQSYLQGETPAPCTRCNPLIKWKTLHDMAVAEGYDHIATGHYFRITESRGHRYVTRGIDPAKDQSYYLWGVTQAQLAMALTPMGEQIKSEVKKRCTNYVNERESMGVCFLQGESYTDFLNREVGGISRGEVVNTQGKNIGTHDGTPLYTVGQKRGLHDCPVGSVVIGVDATQNRLIAGYDNDLYHKELWIREWNLVDEERILNGEEVSVMVRGIGRNPGGTAHVERAGEFLHITLNEAAWALAKGQPVVLYAGDRVCGGGYLINFY